MTLLILGSILFLAGHMISALGLRAKVDAIGGYAICRRLTLQPQPSESKPIYLDGLAIALGLVVYVLFYYFHETLSGVGLS